MDFSIGEDRQMLADTLSRYLGDNFDWKTREAAIESEAGFDRTVWNGLAELGVLGALFGEESGGYGGSAWDVSVIFAEVGKALATGPFLATLMAGRILELAGESEVLGSVISGEKILTFANDGAVGADGRPVPPLVAEGENGAITLTGTMGVVDYLGSADVVLVTVNDARGPSVYQIETDAPGVIRREYPLIDGGAAGELTLAKTPARLVGEEGRAGDALADAKAIGLTACCWEAMGVMDVLRNDTLEYLRTRKQFGVPIGKFQALQHRMATLALEIEQARSAAINAAAAYEVGGAARDSAAAAGKYTVGRVGRLVAEEAIQMHGGIGMTWELPMSHYAKRVTMLNHVLGDDDHHLAEYIRLSR